ncbi:MAG TPA: hypothetical protein VGE39_21875, partial [Prosthecobacter sp.]
MSASHSRLSRAICIAAAGMLAASAPSPALADVGGADAASADLAVIAGTDLTAADFLEAVGKNTRARWRLQFRPPPPTPPTDRGRSALILGTLLGD